MTTRLYLSNQNKFIINSSNETPSMCNVYHCKWDDGNKLKCTIDSTINNENLYCFYGYVNKSCKDFISKINITKFDEREINLSTLEIYCGVNAVGDAKMILNYEDHDTDDIIISKHNNYLRNITKREKGKIILNPNNFYGKIKINYKYINSQCIQTCEIFFLPYPNVRLLKIDKIKENKFCNTDMYTFDKKKYNVTLTFTNCYKNCHNLKEVYELDTHKGNDTIILNYINNITKGDIKNINIVDSSYYCDVYRYEKTNSKSQYFDILTHKAIDLNWGDKYDIVVKFTPNAFLQSQKTESIYNVKLDIFTNTKSYIPGNQSKIFCNLSFNVSKKNNVDVDCDEYINKNICDKLSEHADSYTEICSEKNINAYKTDKLCNEWLNEDRCKDQYSRSTESMNCKKDFSSYDVCESKESSETDNCKKDFSSYDVCGSKESSETDKCKSGFSSYDVCRSKGSSETDKCKSGFSSYDVCGSKESSETDKCKSGFSSYDVCGSKESSETDKCKSGFSSYDVCGSKESSETDKCKSGFSSYSTCSDEISDSGNSYKSYDTCNEKKSCDNIITKKYDHMNKFQTKNMDGEIYITEIKGSLYNIMLKINRGSNIDLEHEKFKDAITFSIINNTNNKIVIKIKNEVINIIEPSYYILFKKNKCKKWTYVTMYLIKDSGKCELNSTECCETSSKLTSCSDNTSGWETCVESSSDNLCYASSSLRSLKYKRECNYSSESESECDYSSDNYLSYSVRSELKCDKKRKRREESSDCSVYENK
jgi:hypothetical protein